MKPVIARIGDDRESSFVPRATQSDRIESIEPSDEEYRPRSDRTEFITFLFISMSICMAVDFAGVLTEPGGRY